MWIATVPLALALYAWLPWPGTWLELTLLLAMIVSLFFVNEATRF